MEYFCTEDRKCIVRVGVRPRKFVVERDEGCNVVPPAAEDSFEKSGCSSSSTGLGSTSCIGTAEMELRVSVVVRGGRLDDGADMVTAEGGLSGSSSLRNVAACAILKMSIAKPSFQMLKQMAVP